MPGTADRQPHHYSASCSSLQPHGCFVENGLAGKLYGPTALPAPWRSLRTPEEEFLLHAWRR